MNMVWVASALARNSGLEIRKPPLIVIIYFSGYHAALLNYYSYLLILALR